MKGCKTHDSILRCSPDVICDWPRCVGHIAPLLANERWKRVEFYEGRRYAVIIIALVALLIGWAL